MFLYAYLVCSELCFLNFFRTKARWFRIFKNKKLYIKQLAFDDRTRSVIVNEDAFCHLQNLPILDSHSLESKTHFW